MPQQKSLKAAAMLQNRAHQVWRRDGSDINGTKRGGIEQRGGVAFKPEAKVGGRAPAARASEQDDGVHGARAVVTFILDVSRPHHGACRGAVEMGRSVVDPGLPRGRRLVAWQGFMAAAPCRPSVAWCRWHAALTTSIKEKLPTLGVEGLVPARASTPTQSTWARRSRQRCDELGARVGKGAVTADAGQRERGVEGGEGAAAARRMFPAAEMARSDGEGGWCAVGGAAAHEGQVQGRASVEWLTHVIRSSSVQLQLQT